MIPHVVTIHHSACRGDSPPPAVFRQGERGKDRQRERERERESAAASQTPFLPRRRQPGPCRPAANAPPPISPSLPLQSSLPFFHCLSLHPSPSAHSTSLHLYLPEYFFFSFFLFFLLYPYLPNQLFSSCGQPTSHAFPFYPPSLFFLLSFSTSTYCFTLMLYFNPLTPSSPLPSLSILPNLVILSVSLQSRHSHPPPLFFFFFCFTVFTWLLWLFSRNSLHIQTTLRCLFGFAAELQVSWRPCLPACCHNGGSLENPLRESQTNREHKQRNTWNRKSCGGSGPVYLRVTGS